MEKRFTVKDLILVVLLLVLIVSVWLAMKQYDRQWGELRLIREGLDEQRRDLREIQASLASGVVVNEGGGRAATTQSSDPFQRIRAAKQTPGYVTGGVLIDGFDGAVKNLTPLLAGDAYAGTVQSYVLESLCDRDPDTLEWRPLLCREWEVIDQIKQQDEAIAKLKAAGKKDEEIAADTSVPPAILVKFKMRPNVRFSDGEPLTADDVVFTFEFTMNPKINAPRDRAYLHRIQKVEKTGEDEVTFTFREPYFRAFELAGSIGIIPKHFYSKYSAEEFNESVGLLLGSGPYRMESPTGWKPGTLIQLVRNERYWGVTAAFDKIVWKETASDVALMAAFRNGDIDIYSARPEPYSQMIRDAGLVARSQNFELQTPVNPYRYVGWNQRRGGQPTVFADVRIRRAMTMLLDRNRLIKEVMLGYAAEASGPFSSLSKQSNPEVKPWAYDVSAANKLLAEAGFKDRDGDGVIESEQGKPFSFKLTYPTGIASYEKMILFMKDAYARAGIALVPDPLDWTILQDRLGKKDFDAITLAWGTGIESDIYQMFHSAQTVEEGDNTVNYRSAEFDRVVDQARRTVDEEKRMGLWREAHKILHEDQPYTFLFFPKELAFMDGRVKNVQKIRIGLNSRLEWFIPKQQQRAF